jgi:hypothetical protein
VIRDGGEPDLSELARSVLEVRRRVEELEVAGRIVDASLKLAQRSVIRATTDEPVLRVLNEALAGVLDEGRKAVAKLSEDVTPREVMRGDRAGQDAYPALERAAATYGRLTTR